MKILYYDCFSGISGDMNLGALVDLGVPADYLITELGKLHVTGYKICLTKELKMGISGTKCTVELEHDHKHPHNHSYSDKNHNHLADFSNLNVTENNTQPEGHHHHDHEHRNYQDIKKIIENSKLNEFVKDKSLAIFHEVAVAEAKIHGKDMDNIHFHEVGAIDSIVDIVGAAICVDYLKPDRIICSSVELGGGFVKCAHGTFPVPAPATSEILKGIPVKMGKVDKETTTPTGSAILKVFVDEFLDIANFTIQKTAYGIGHRDLVIPNVLRVYFGECSNESKFLKETAVLIECNIDDMNPEHYDYIINKLMDTGAQDVFLVPIIMKKSRPAVQLKVLCALELQPTLENIILHETTTLGLRSQQFIKTILERKTRIIETKFGPIRIKEAIVSGKPLKYKAEYDDCLKAAIEKGVPLTEVYNEVDRCMNL
jgi:pyridinium-3,5-bisthiocarboxylic acid mononucleotide nickel chelatase